MNTLLILTFVCVVLFGLAWHDQPADHQSRNRNRE